MPTIIPVPQPAAPDKWIGTSDRMLQGRWRRLTCAEDALRGNLPPGKSAVI